MFHTSKNEEHIRSFWIRDICSSMKVSGSGPITKVTSGWFDAVNGMWILVDTESAAQKSFWNSFPHLRFKTNWHKIVTYIKIWTSVLENCHPIKYREFGKVYFPSCEIKFWTHQELCPYRRTFGWKLMRICTTIPCIYSV